MEWKDLRFVPTLRSEDSAQMPQFVLHLLESGDGVGDLFAKELMIALAHSLHGFLDRFFGHAGCAQAQHPALPEG